MKKVENMTTDIIGAEEKKMKYSDLALICVKNVNPQKGLGLEEMRQGIKIMKILEKEPEIIELEDADYNFLLQKVNGMSWAMYHKDVVAFSDAINEAK